MNNTVVSDRFIKLKIGLKWFYFPIIVLFIIGLVIFLNSSIRLPIFSENGLAHSVFPPVLFGIAVMTLGAELFGWIYSGLLVPGFIAPILILEPWAALLMIIEALLTYYLVLVISSIGSKAGLWSEFFGRERFFAILLASVGVRLLIEGQIIEIIGLIINQQLLVPFDYRNSLFSVGFVFVPLLANMFWNTGVRRAFWPITISIFITYLITRYFLVEHTSFSLSYLSLIYESTAIDFTASPKAHIILLTSAFLASHSNIRYGWDFNGILVPSLLALVWTTPTKLAATIIESLLILAIARFITSHKRFETTTIEGPRKILLLFSISFTLKMALDATISLRWPGLTAIDFYGFGYLLSTLMAAKMWQKGSINMVLIPVLRTSFLAAIIGNLVGFALTFLPANDSPVAGNLSLIENRVVEFSSDNLFKRVLLSRGRLRATSLSNNSSETVRDLALFESAFDQIISNQISSNRIDQDLNQLLNTLDKINYEVLLFKNIEGELTDLMLREKDLESIRGWGFYILSAKAETDLIINIPFKDRDSLELGLLLYKRLGARALVASGSGTLLQSRYSSSKQTISDIVCRKFRTAAILDIKVVKSGSSKLAIRNRLPESLDLTLLKEIIGEYDLELNKDFRNNQRALNTLTGYAELSISNISIVEAISIQPEIETKNLEVEGYLLNWVFNRPSAKNSSEIVLPTRDEKKFFDEYILTPIFASAGQGLRRAEINCLQFAASVVGYDLILFRSSHNGREYIILSESEPRIKRWGTIIVRLAETTPLILEVPQADLETNALLFSIQLLEQLDGSVLIISDLNHNIDQSLNSQSNDPIFNLAHQRAQILLARNRDKIPPVAVQVRSTIVPSEKLNSEIVINAGFEIPDRTILSYPIRLFIDRLEVLGHKIDLYDGSRQRVAFGGKNNEQRIFSNRFFPGTFVILWALNHSGVNLYEEARIATYHSTVLGLERMEGSFEQWALTRFLPLEEEIPEQITPIVDSIERYSLYRNIHDLRKGALSARTSGFVPLYFYDQVTGQGFFVLTYKGTIAYILRLGALSKDRIEISQSRDLISTKLSSFIYGRTALLEVRK